MHTGLQKPDKQKLNTISLSLLSTQIYKKNGSYVIIINDFKKKLNIIFLK